MIHFGCASKGKWRGTEDKTADLMEHKRIFLHEQCLKHMQIRAKLQPPAFISLRHSGYPIKLRGNFKFYSADRKNIFGKWIDRSSVTFTGPGRLLKVTKALGLILSIFNCISLRHALVLFLNQNTNF